MTVREQALQDPRRVGNRFAHSWTKELVIDRIKQWDESFLCPMCKGEREIPRNELQRSLSVALDSEKRLRAENERLVEVLAGIYQDGDKHPDQDPRDPGCVACDFWEEAEMILRAKGEITE